MALVKLNEENYYSREANLAYMSVSMYKKFAGTYGKRACEFKAMEELGGRWEDEQTDALLIGSYVDRYFEGSLDRFLSEHPEMFRGDGMPPSTPKLTRLSNAWSVTPTL